MVIILHLPNKCSPVLNLRQNICIGISTVASKYFPFSYTSFSNKFYEIYIQKYNLKDISNRIIGYANHDRIQALVPKNNHLSWQLLFLLTLKKNSQLHTKSGEKNERGFTATLAEVTINQQLKVHSHSCHIGG